MKKHGERMEWIGMLALVLLAMASDGGRLGVLPLVLLAVCSVSIILLGYLFTRPCPACCRTRRATVIRPASAAQSVRSLGRAA